MLGLKEQFDSPVLSRSIFPSQLRASREWIYRTHVPSRTFSLYLYLFTIHHTGEIYNIKEQQSYLIQSHDWLIPLLLQVTNVFQEFVVQTGKEAVSLDDLVAPDCNYCTIFCLSHALASSRQTSSHLLLMMEQSLLSLLHLLFQDLVPALQHPAVNLQFPR